MSRRRPARARGLIAVGVALTVLAMACRLEPPELAKVRASYERAAADAEVRERADFEIYEAEQALDKHVTPSTGASGGPSRARTPRRRSWTGSGNGAWPCWRGRTRWRT